MQGRAQAGWLSEAAAAALAGAEVGPGGAAELRRAQRLRVTHPRQPGGAHVRAAGMKHALLCVQKATTAPAAAAAKVACACADEAARQNSVGATAAEGACTCGRRPQGRTAHNVHLHAVLQKTFATVQVKSACGEWITAAPIPGTFVCNVGDMLRVYSNGEAFPPAHTHA